MMVMARLHVICGNCGSNDDLEFEYQQHAGDNGDGTFESDVCIKCKNCTTLHWLSDNAEQKEFL